MILRKEYLSLAQVIDDLFRRKPFPGHLLLPFSSEPRCSVSLTKHVDPFKGGQVNRG